MTSGRFFVAGTTAIFRTRHRPCERGSRCHSREKRKSNRLDLYCGQPRRLGYAVRDAILGHFLSRQSTPKRLASLQRRPDARFIPAFSFTHVGALHRSTLHSAMNLIRRNIQIKKAPQPGVAAGTLWRLRRPNGPANLRLKRGYAASNSKTNIELSIFPNPYAPAFSKTGCARQFCACGTARPRGCPTVSMTSREHARKEVFHAEKIGPSSSKE